MNNFMSQQYRPVDPRWATECLFVLLFAILVIILCITGRSSRPCRCLRIRPPWWIHLNFATFSNLVDLVPLQGQQQEGGLLKGIFSWKTSKCAFFIQFEKPWIDYKIVCIVVRLAATQHFKMQYSIDKGCWFHMCCTQCLFLSFHRCRSQGLERKISLLLDFFLLNQAACPYTS